VHHNEKICDKIVSEIRKSGLLVADFTGNRGGVYFEAGFAMGLSIPVIWTCRASDVEKLHFGLAAYIAEKRTKETGIRKVLGTTLRELLMLLTKDIFILVIISSLIAWPISYYIMN